MSEIQQKLKNAVNSYNRKVFDESVELFRSVLEEDPSNPEANYYMGLMYSKDKNFPKAVTHLKSIVDLGVSFIFTHQCRMLLGYMYYETGEYDRALFEFSNVLKSNFNIPQVYAALSAVCYKMDEFDKSLEFANKAYSMDNFNLNAKNTYGFLLCDLEVDPDKGVELLKDVVRLKPDNPAYLDSLGWGYYKKGDLKSSIATLKDALNYSKNEEIKNHYNIVIGIKKSSKRSGL